MKCIAFLVLCTALVVKASDSDSEEFFEGVMCYHCIWEWGRGQSANKFNKTITILHKVFKVRKFVTYEVTMVDSGKFAIALYKSSGGIRTFWQKDNSIEDRTMKAEHTLTIPYNDKTDGKFMVLLGKNDQGLKFRTQFMDWTHEFNNFEVKYVK